jgi:hypothetical protein
MPTIQAKMKKIKTLWKFYKHPCHGKIYLHFWVLGYAYQSTIIIDEYAWLQFHTYTLILHFQMMNADALLSSLLNPLEGPSALNCGNMELGGTPDFQH